MDDNMKIRAACVNDLPTINDIYNHYVLTCTCTYQIEPETMESRARWFASHGQGHPVIVAEVGGRVVGWGSLSRYNSREAYDRMSEDSVYIHRDAQGRGIGTVILTELIRLGRQAGNHSIIAVISAEQTPSIALHAKMGFTHAGLVREVGYKFGRWLDVTTMQLMLDAPATNEQSGAG